MHRIAFLSLAVSLAAVPAARPDGMLDPSFGNGGLVVTQFASFQRSVANAVAVQPDGRAVAAGWTIANLEQTFMGVTRYLPSGALDTTFSGTGMAMVSFPGIPQGFIDVFASAEQVLVQPDGRILLVGGLNVFAGNYFALARLNPDGSLDPNFGVGGKVMTRFAIGGGPYSGGGWAVAGLLQPDGRIVAVGLANPSSPGLAAARYNANGRVDHTFGTLGQVILTLPSTFEAGGAALQPDGRIVIAGTYASGDFGVVRLLPNGLPDPSFDGDGLATADFGGIEKAYSVALLPDGRIVVGGYRYAASQWAGDLAMTRFLADGTLDTSFGTGGLATANAGPYEIPGQVLRLPNGKLLLTGSATNTSDETDFLLERYHADGTLDTTFGTGGLLRTDFGASVDELHAVILAGPDLVLTAGATGAAYSAGDFALARYILTTQAAERASESR